MSVQRAVILHPNFLVATGLKSLLKEYFAVNVTYSSSVFDKEVSNIVIKSEFEQCYIYTPWFEDNKKKLQKILLGKLVLLDENNLGKEDETPFLNILLNPDEMTLKLHAITDTFADEPVKNDSPELSLREKEVLRLVTKGLLNKEIADSLNISIHTVIAHRRNITSRLGIKTVSGLTVYAIINGIISSEMFR